MRPDRHKSRALVAGCLLFAAAGRVAAQQSQPPPPPANLAAEVVAGLAGLGPRPDGGAAQERATAFLLDTLRRAGLQEVRAVTLPSPPVPARRHAPASPAAPPPPKTVVVVQGVHPGKGADEILLSGHYDSVVVSPGADDDASGCGVAIAAAADLARTPLQHTVRVLLFSGEERGLLGSRAWADGLDAAGRDRILADLNLEMVGWPAGRGATIHALPVRNPDGSRSFPPGWLVHAVLQSGAAVDWPYAMSDARFPLAMQLVQRSLTVRFGADSESLQARGVPALTLSDSSFFGGLDPAYHKATDRAANVDPRRLARWSEAVAAAVRRLDSLAGRPVAEDQFLVLFGRVWLRRDLLWVGFALWALLVFRGRPGRFRGASIEEQREQRRRYLPGYAFRLFLLFAVLAAPVLAILLYPAAALGIAFPAARGSFRLRALVLVLGLLPLLGFALLLLGSIGMGIGSLRGVLPAGALPAFLLTASAVSWAVSHLVADRVRTPAPPVVRTPGPGADAGSPGSSAS